MDLSEKAVLKPEAEQFMSIWRMKRSITWDIEVGEERSFITATAKLNF
jgi:hypothetical protein